MNSNDSKFDDAIRAQHDASLERLSPRVRAQLAQRRNAGNRAAPHGNLEVIEADATGIHGHIGIELASLALVAAR